MTRRWLSSIAVLAALWSTPLAAQISGTTLNINTTPIVGGTNGNCLYDNAGKVGEQTCGGAAANVTVGTSTITGGTTLRVLYDNAGVLGEYTAAQVTALINVATASLSGALPAWPNNTTTFLRGDGSYATLNCAALTNATASCSTDATNASNIASGTLPTGRLTGSYTGITGLGTLTAGATGAGFTVALGTSTVTGTLAATNGGTGVSNSANLTVSSATSVGRGQYQGTNTNDAATSGNIGEYPSSSIPSASAVSLTSGAAANVTSVSLGAGDWDCRGNIITNPNAATTSSAFFGWISTTSAAFPTQPNGGAYVVASYALGAGGSYAESVGSAQFLLSGTTTVYLSTIVNFAVNTNSAFGFLGCRRMR